MKDHRNISQNYTNHEFFGGSLDYVNSKMANQERVGCTSSIFFIIVGFSKYFSLTIICEYILVKIYNVFLGNIKKREIHSRVPLLSSQSILSEPAERGMGGGGHRRKDNRNRSSRNR